MSYLGYRPGSTKKRLCIQPFPKSYQRMRLFSLVFVLCLGILLFADTQDAWPLAVSQQAYASAATSPAAATTTLQKFLQLGKQNEKNQPFIPQKTVPPVMQKAIGQAVQAPAKTLPSAEPAKMKPLSYVLDNSFVLNRPASASSLTPSAVQGTAIPAGTTPLSVLSSDGRLEIQLPRGSVDLAHAKLQSNSAPSGTLTLQISQKSGHYVSASSFLGTYQIQVVDAQGHAVDGIQLRHPLTIRYHYTPQEMYLLHLDPGQILLSWPELLLAARTAKQPTTNLIVPFTNDAKAHTLTAQTLVLKPSSVTLSGQSAFQAPPTPNVATVVGNSGQLSYSYPLSVAPGPDNFAPQLAVNYSSGSTNQRYSSRSPAGDEGDGWSLSLGSISAETLPSSSAAPGVWYSLSGVGGVSDRLDADTVAGPGFFQTQHVSRMRILFSNNCFHIWDKSGTYYELGCTSDSRQYTWDPISNTQMNYRWDVNKIFAPYNATTQVKTLFVSYLQDQTTTPTGNHPVIRDAVLKQISYGFVASTASTSLSQTAGTVDFQYHGITTVSGGPAGSNWETAYTANYNCQTTPPETTMWRCDDPITYHGNSNLPPPQVMSTFTLDKVTSYVGKDDGTGSPAFSYAFSYQDSPFSDGYYDAYSQVEEYAAGLHLLAGITPTVYQNGSAKGRKGLTLGYTGRLQDNYLDTDHSTSNPNQSYGGQTYWSYLNSYQDLDTGVGASISYMDADNNSHGTPTITDGNGYVTDDLHDPLYCSLNANNSDTSKRCTGTYLNPDYHAWSVQVVRQIQTRGTDSSSSSLSQPITTYNYQMAETPLGCTVAGLAQCVSDYWSPVNVGVPANPIYDTDWLDYYHGEYRGFSQVYITSATGNVTLDQYHTTMGWHTRDDYPENYNAGSLTEQDVYIGNDASNSTHLLRSTVNSYTGDGSFPSSCDGSLDATYIVCEVMLMRSRTTSYEGMGSPNSAAPWVQTDNTYDDYNANATQYALGTGYHNLTQTITSSSNAPSLTKKWSYQINDQTTGGITYYDVNKPSSSEIDDQSGHVWQCQESTYDEGRPTGVPVPAAGFVTTQTAHSDCSSQTAKNNTALTSYTGYDQYGNVVASVDAFGVANSSLYSTKGCTLSTAPTLLSPSWTRSHYTSCATYDTTHGSSLPLNAQNVLGQTTSTAYDYTQGALPISAIDVNAQTTTTSYSYDSNGNAILQVKQPGALSSYSSQSSEKSQCTSSSTLPCYEIDTNSSLYAGAVTRTFYDNMGRVGEKRTPLDATHDLISFTVNNDASATTFQSEPFRVPSGSGWLDPNGATDESGNAPAGTVTLYDALGRVQATQDAIIGSTAEPGIECWPLSGVWSSCNTYSVDSPTGGSTLYDDVLSTNANSFNTMTFVDALGRTRYTQWYNALNVTSPTADLTRRQETQYNVLDEPTAVIVTDLSAQPGQTITSVTTSVTYNDLGQQLTLNDPDRGTHTSSYDADGRVIKDVSGSRTIGISYDLLGRALCEQDATPTTDGSGSCSSGSHPLVQNTYDTTKLGTAGSTDFSVGALTQSVSTTYYPDGTSSATTSKVQHDQRGRPITGSLQITVPSSWSTTLPTYQETQSYNDANQPMTTHTTVGSSAGYTFSQGYDGTTGALLGVSNTTVGNTSLASQSYDLHGQVTGLNFPSSTGTSLVSDHFTYDGDLRPSSTTATWSANNTNFFNKSLTYDPVGNVISTTTSQPAVSGQSNSGGSEVEDFCYDAESRLIWAGNSGTVPNEGGGTSCGTAMLANTLNGASYSSGYNYTQLGQLWQGPLNGTGTDLQYLYCNSSQPHQLTGLYAAGTTCANRTNPSYSASYDSWGNETSRTYKGTTATLSYDKQDKLVQWNAGSTNKAWYAYDASGGRTLARSITGSGTSLTVYAFGLEEHVYNGSGSNVSNTYYYTFGDRLIGKFDGTNTQYYLTDAQGSVLSTFSNGVNTTIVLGDHVYGPYGNTLNNSGSMGTAKGFTGQYQDPTGLDYYNARYYDPVVGRFLSADTVQGNGQGMDPYAYVGNNPVTYQDPTGHEWSPSLPSLGGAVADQINTFVDDLAATVAGGLLSLSTGFFVGAAAFFILGLYAYYGYYYVVPFIVSVTYNVILNDALGNAYSFPTTYSYTDYASTFITTDIEPLYTSSGSGASSTSSSGYSGAYSSGGSGSTTSAGTKVKSGLGGVKVLPAKKQSQNAKPQAKPQPVTPSEPIYRKDFNNCGDPFNDLEARKTTDYRFDENGLVKPGRGSSTGTKSFMESKGWWDETDGSIHQVNSLPDDLGYFKTGSPGHYEISPLESTNWTDLQKAISNTDTSRLGGPDVCD